MAHYLFQVSYTAAAWAAFLKNPQDRSKAVTGAVEELGGKVEGFWMSFGESDIIGVVQMPDNVSMAAFAFAVAAGGACKSVNTTPLMTMDEGQAAMKKAAASKYRPPSAKRSRRVRDEGDGANVPRDTTVLEGGLL
jgi:uncharacterized protein with GYD domain